MSYHVHIIETVVLPGQKPTMAKTWCSARYDTYGDLRQAQTTHADEYGKQHPAALAIESDNGATRDFVDALAPVGVKITRVGITQLANGPDVALDVLKPMTITARQHGYAEGVAHMFRTGTYVVGEMQVPAEYVDGPSWQGTVFPHPASEYAKEYHQGAIAARIALAHAHVAARDAKES
ncbi:hypothetical protein NJBCHELONAE_43780 [Mycobacteroides chelonae]|uniref:hypothetical protein n=1 Tax=Mycobacteroides chelonae TaxID=1774 RepID=UPI0021DC46F1|nr:hypothetical protein [Mycobacteroides chelonae]GLE59067.1 hypothetical protein NJBCHELONAE_43780 [Mycobacteroides chelonae]